MNGWILATIGAASAAAVATVVLMLRRRPSAALREQRRRLAVNGKGRMVDATVLDFRENELLYSYVVRGVQYTTSQDVSALREFLPEDLSSLIGAAVAKYHPSNPANSILLCEQWSGLRAGALRQPERVRRAAAD